MFRVKIVKATPTVTLTQNGTDVIATVSGNVTGNVTFYIRGQNYTVDLENGNATLSNNLTYGNNYIVATYNGDKNYTDAFAVENFEIAIITTDLTVEATPEVMVGKNTTITVTMTNVTGGKVIIEVNGYNYTVEINNNGIATLTVSLPVNEYTAHAYYLGDLEHEACDNVSAVFKVLNKTAPSVTIADVGNIEIDTNLTFTVTTNSNATLVVRVNGEVVNQSADGKYRYNGTVAKEYNITASVAENDYYFKASNYTLFNVYKHASEIASVVAAPENVIAGKNTIVTVTMANNESGKVMIEIGGHNYTVEINNQHKAVLVVALPAGNYTAHAYYLGDDKYNATDKVSAEFNVTAKRNATVIINAVSVVEIDGKLVFNVTNSTPVVVTINDVVYTPVNGNYTFDAKVVGNYTIVARSNETDDYYAGFDTKVFSVVKRNSTVKVEANSINVTGTVKINITAPSDIDGIVKVNVSGTVYAVNIAGGHGTLELKDLKEGPYTVNVTYLENDKYLSSANDTGFTVSKLNATVHINAANSTYDETETITVTVPGAEGNVTIKLNDTKATSITQKLVDGKAVFNITKLGAGNYTVDVTYNGNDIYNINDTESATFEVRKADPKLFILSFSCVVYENGTIEISINPETAGEKLNITVGDVKYTDVVIPGDGMLRFITDPLNEFKSYEVTVEYAGDDNFAASVFKNSYHTTKINTYGLNISAMNITVGDDEIITVEVPQHVDDVVIWVNGEKYRNTSFTDNKAKFNITGLKQGIYTVTATVNDTEFDDRNFTAIFTVNKTSVPMNITIFNSASIYVGDTVKVVVSVPKDVTENVTIEINSIRLTNVTVNGNATFYVPSITYGNKTVVAAYVGDDKYYYNSTTANFTVNKRNSQVNVTAKGNDVGGIATITVQVQSNATGYVTVNVNGTDYTISLNSTGTGSINITGLGNGTYYVHATYIGDDQYLTSENNTETFEMVKAVPVINIDVDNVTYGTETVIVVTVPGATGNVTIKINDTDEGEFTLVNGKVTFNAGILGVENYTVYVLYKGDDKYSAGSASEKFNVSKATPTITIEGITVDANTNASVRVIINVDASGSLNITVNKKNYTAPIVGGVAVFTVDKLPVGKYDIVANYTGDANYNAKVETLVQGLEVIKVQNYEINVTAVDVHVGENTTITIHVPKDATGTVTVWVNGTEKVNSTIVDGVATVQLNKTLSGRYVVNATLTDAKYADQTVYTTYWVSKVETPITITVNNKDDIKVGDTVTITVDLPDDIVGEKVTIEINGKSYEQVTGADGIAAFTVPSVTYGNKTVAAVYVGNNKYVNNATTANFTVSKRASQVDVTGDVIVVGENATVTVNVTSGATGYVVVRVDGQNYTINLTQSRGSVTITGLKNATYPITATYLGDDKYLGNVSQTANVTVNKLPISIFVTDMNNEDKDVNLTPIISGDDKIIVVQMNPQINGFVTLIVEEVGSNNPKSYKVAIVNGRGQYVVSNLHNATYNIKAVFAGDDKYEAQNSTVKQLMVNNIITNLTITIDKHIIFVGDKAVVSITLNQSINAVVTVKVNGANHTVGLVNGKGDFTLANLTEGNYIINAVFAGDDRYVNSTSNTVKCNVTKIPTGLTVNATSAIVVGNDAVINITLNETIDANVVLRVNGKEYNVAIIGGFGNFTVANLPVGTYYINATYAGSDKYIASTSQTVEMNVSKAGWEARVIAQNATVEENPSFVITAPIDFDGNVSIKVDGVEYYDDVFKTLTEISKFEAGNYTANVTFYGDSKYANRTYLVNFTVFRINSIIAVTIDDTTYPTKAVAQITVSGYANGTVNITVDGKQFNGTVSNGVANVDLTGLSAGSKEAKVEFTSTDKHNNDANASYKFIIIPNNSLIEIRDIKEVYKVGEDIEIKIVTYNSTGDVTISINGVYYDQFRPNPGSHEVCIDNLAAGNYTVTFVLEGDQNYTGYSTSASFKVVKHQGEVNITVDKRYEIGSIFDIEIGNNTVVNVTINGVKYEVANGKVVIDTAKLAAGNYTVTATIFENDKYYANITSETFEIFKHTAVIKNITVPSADVVMGKNATITVNMDNVTSGYVLIEVDGHNYTVAIVNKVANLTVELPVGNYTARAYFIENDKYYGNESAAVEFKVIGKLTPEIIITAPDVVKVGDTVNITVKTNGYNLAVWINDVEQTVTDGNISFVVPSAGSYAVKATVTENDTMYAASNFTVFDAVKNNATLIIGEINAGLEHELTITVTNITDGIVIIKVNNIIVPDGKFTPMVSGVYTVTVESSETDKYYAGFNMTSFKLDVKDSPVIVIDAPDKVKVGDTVNIVVASNGYNLTVWINGVKQDIVDGNISYTVTTAGINTIVAKTTENETVYAANKTVVFEAIKNNATLIISEITVVQVGGTVTITVTNITDGEVNIKLNGVEIENNTQFTPALSGNYTVTVESKETGKYLAGFNTTTFTVLKSCTAVDITVDPIHEIESDFTISITNDTVVNVTINGKAYEVKDGKVVIDTTVLAAGNYTVTATIYESGKYLGNTTTKVFTIYKHEASISSIVSTPEVVVGENTTITVAIANVASGTLLVEVAGHNYTVAINDYKAVLDVALPAGEYDVKAHFLGDDKYNATDLENDTKFKVTGKSVPVVVINAPNTVEIGKELVFTVENSTAVNVTINGVEIPLVDGKYTFSPSEAGNYTIVARTVETDYYYAGFNTTVFNVAKHNSTVRIIADETYMVGEAFNITIESNTVANVTINGKPYTIVDGKVVIPAGELAAGEYIINAVVDESQYYNANRTSQKFTILKHDSTIIVSADPIKVDDVAIITIKVSGDVDATVKVNVNGTNYTVDIKGGEGKLEIAGLKAGKYDVNVTYIENGKYLSNSNKTEFTVSKINSKLEVEVVNTTLGKNALINVTVEDDATGNVTVTIGDKIYVEGIVNGKANFIIPYLNVDEYEVTVTYNGDGKYLTNSTETKLSVTQSEEYSINVVDNGDGTLTVTVPGNATGNITVNINGTNYSANVTNGKAVVDISNATPGSYNATVDYSGDNDHTAKSTTVPITVPKYSTEMTIEVDNYKVGETVKVTVIVPKGIEGEVTIEIDGLTYSKAPENGKAVFEITDTLLAGDKTVTATYAGDEKYLHNATTKDFTVSKNNAPFTIKAEAIDTDGNVRITVSDLPNDATGYVIINIEGKEYSINITSGNETVVKMDATGSYTAKATYLGDYKYLSNTSSATFKASKSSTDVSVEVNDTYAGDEVTVKVTVPEDATGNITVKVGNTTKTVPATGGENIITISNVTKGTNDVNVTYAGDDKYDSKTIVKTITVITSINSDENLKRGWDSPFDFEAEFLAKDGSVLQNTEVKFEVNGKTYTVKTDSEGIARLTDAHLAVGTHEVKSINPQTGEEKTRNVTIVKRILENKDVTMDFADGSSYKVKVIGDDGNPVGAGEFVAIKVNGITYVAKTNAKGYASLKLNLNPKSYTITAEYKNTKVSNKVKVKQTLKLVKKTVKVKKGKKIVLKAKLKWSNGKPIKGKKIVFKFKGKKYNAKTNKKGIAKVTIKKKSVLKKLKKGKKYKYTASYKKNTVKGKVKVKK